MEIKIRQSPIGFTTCLDRQTILDEYNGDIIEDVNTGIVSVYLPSVSEGPITLSKVCCEALDPRYFFDIENQTCRFAPLIDGCALDNPFNLVLNPLGNAGTLFYVEGDDNCSLQIDLDYLFKIKCETLSDILNGNGTCATPIEMLETFDVSLTLDVVTSANTLQTLATFALFPAIGVGNLYNYLSGNTASGFYICGDSTDGCTPLSFNLSGISQINTTACENVMDNLINDLFDESGLGSVTDGNDIFISNISQTALASQWLHFTTAVTDTLILNAIRNQSIKISIKINHTCGDFCVLIDEIVLDKVCTHVEKNSIFLTQSPGFELERIRDNKKSWVNNTDPVNRPFVINNNKGTNGIRQTNYDVNDERLVINTKEIDLDINLAKAIETDVWCYLSDNPCILTGVTSCLPCIDECGSKNFQDDECFAFMDGYFYNFMDGVTTGNTSLFNHANCCGDSMIDFQSLMTQPLSAVTTIEDFEYFLTSELIDVKNRQTLSGYPTLRALYDRYMNSGIYCGNNSSKFDYMTMEQFASLVGNYWVDIVEQVIPATTIWGSVKVYTNTIFDQQKYKYKSYSSLFCGNPFEGQNVPSPINGTTGQCQSVNVITTTIGGVNTQQTFQAAPLAEQAQAAPSGRRRKSVVSQCNSLCIAQMNSGSEFIGTVTISGPAIEACDPNNASIGEGIILSEIITNYTEISLNIQGAQSPILYNWSNGDTGSTTTMTAGTYNVTVIDANCKSATLEFVVPPIELTACWYSLQEKPEFLISRMVCGDEYPYYTAFTFNIVGVEVNGVELVATTGYSTTITSGTTNLIPASNAVLSGCTFGSPTGVTYTDFVDLINLAFIDLGLTNYSAQISLIDKLGGVNQGFYIIRPITDVFTIKTSGTQQLKYTDTLVTLWSDSETPYYNSICDGNNLVNGVVIE